MDKDYLKLMTKSIYITGVGGLLGSNAAKKFLKEGFRVGGCDNLIGGLIDNVPAGVEYNNIDILDFPSLKKSMKGYHYVFHAAALPYEGLSVFSPGIVVNNIVGGTTNVASACIANDVQFMVNCSSMARYGRQTPPFTEDMPRAPVDPYGLAKAQAEEQLELLNKLHGFRYATVVPHNVIGVGQRYMDPFRNVVGIMINRALQDKEIVIYGDGSQKRSFSDIHDCIDAVYKIMTSARDLTGQVFNIGPDDNEVSIKELADIVYEHTDSPHTGYYEYYPDRPAEVKNAWCSSIKIKREFNYNTTKTLEQTINDMVWWVKERGTKPFEYHLELEFVKDNTPKTWTEQKI